jgi:hypothetical protein
MPAAIPALIMGGSAAFGGIMQHRAAGKGANAQVQATQDVERMYGEALPRVNSRIASAGSSAGSNYLHMSEEAARGVYGATDEANALLNPYMDAGAQSLTRLGDLANGPGFEFSEDDPSYQWRLQQGQQALERSAAARGGMGGGTLKAMTRYAQGAASQEYQAAFDRFRSDRGDRALMLSNVAGMGLDASGQAGRNTINAGMYAGDAGMRGAEYAGNAQMWSAGEQGRNEMWATNGQADARMGAGNARAAEGIAKGNAWAGIANGVGNAAQLYTLGKMFGPQSNGGRTMQGAGDPASGVRPDERVMLPGMVRLPYGMNGEYVGRLG